MGRGNARGQPAEIHLSAISGKHASWSAATLGRGTGSYLPLSTHSAMTTEQLFLMTHFWFEDGQAAWARKDFKAHREAYGMHALSAAFFNLHQRLIRR